MGLPGVAAVNIGPHDAEQLRRNVDWAIAYRRLSGEENATLAKVGRRLASEWGEHFGPAADRPSSVRRPRTAAGPDRTTQAH